jgi:O-succinylbenzoic acid--CoA ligase
MPARPLAHISVPPGPEGVNVLTGPLRAALDGTGPAIAPIPVVTAATSAEYVSHLLEATKPNDDSFPLEFDEVAVVLATSGSTQRPKGVLHSAASLNALSEAIQGGACPQWIAALPLTSMGGFNVVLRAAETDLPAIGLNSLGGLQPFTAQEFSATVRIALQRSPDVRVSLVAAQVRRLLADAGGVEALLACNQILVGGGPLPASTAAASRDAGINLTTTYGATETAGGCVYNSQPLPGVEITIDQFNNEIVLTGQMVALGYRAEPQQTADRFFGRSYRTGDLGTYTDHLVIDGRNDDVITINGINVSINAVEEQLNNIECVHIAAVVAQPAGNEEFELFAAIALNSGSVDETEVVQILRNAVHNDLGKAAVPRNFAFLTELPMLPNNKIDRRAISQLTHDGALWQR